MLLWAGSTRSVSRKGADLDSFFERALGLVSEVNRLLSTAENDEDVVEYCTHAGLQTASALVFLQ